MGPLKSRQEVHASGILGKMTSRPITVARNGLASNAYISKRVSFDEVFLFLQVDISGICQCVPSYLIAWFPVANVFFRHILIASVLLLIQTALRISRFITFFLNSFESMYHLRNLQVSSPGHIFSITFKLWNSCFFFIFSLDSMI